MNIIYDNHIFTSFPSGISRFILINKDTSEFNSTRIYENQRKYRDDINKYIERDCRYMQIKFDELLCLYCLTRHNIIATFIVPLNNFELIEKILHNLQIDKYKTFDIDIDMDCINHQKIEVIYKFTPKFINECIELEPQTKLVDAMFLNIKINSNNNKNIQQNIIIDV
jgi:hypothetical protein